MMEQVIQSAEELQRVYDQVYEKKPIDQQEPHYRWVSNLLKLQRGKRLLDVGCGAGWMLYEAAKRRLIVRGIDLSPKAVALARQQAPQAEVVTGDGSKLPWPEASFDYVTCLGSLQHYTDPSVGLREIARVVKFDGTAAIMVPNRFYLKKILREIKTGQALDEQDRFERLLAQREWRALIEANGLQVVQVVRRNEVKPLFSWISWLYRLFCPLDFSYQFLFLCRRRT